VITQRRKIDFAIGFGQRAAGGGSAGAVTILGTKPERNAAAEPLTEADATAFPTSRARDERAGNDEGGPERH